MLSGESVFRSQVSVRNFKRPVTRKPHHCTLAQLSPKRWTVILPLAISHAASGSLDSIHSALRKLFQPFKANDHCAGIFVVHRGKLE